MFDGHVPNGNQDLSKPRNTNFPNQSREFTSPGEMWQNGISPATAHNRHELDCTNHVKTRQPRQRKRKRWNREESSYHFIPLRWECIISARDRFLLGGVFRNSDDRLHPPPNRPSNPRLPHGPSRLRRSRQSLRASGLCALVGVGMGQNLIPVVIGKHSILRSKVDPYPTQQC